MRRTKIVCTIGPSSSAPDNIRDLIGAGMNVARLNCSHGTHETHRQNFKNIREIAADLGENVAIILDLQGPKIRTGKLKEGKPIHLDEGALLCITTRDTPGDEACLSTTYPNLPKDVKTGDTLLLADGALELRADRVDPPDIYCRIIRGGPLGQHKGINLPGVEVSAPALTEKDLEDLKFGLGLGPDYIALSFVRKPEDLRRLRQQIEWQKNNRPAVIAKIERPEALEHFDAILPLADAIMVARGDLGIEVNLNEIPQIQKEIIRNCNDHGTPVITATQMLESMMNNPRPTRAEVTDVANAIYDGTDALMLSGETAAGRYPIEALHFMDGIARKADEAIAATTSKEHQHRSRPALASEGLQSDAIGEAIFRMVHALDISRIVCFTQSGYTARAIARYRPPVPISAITLDEATRRRCTLIWGVEAIHSVELNGLDEMIATVERLLLDRKLARQGDTIIIAAGTPLAVGGVTNLLKLHTIGEAL